MKKIMVFIYLLILSNSIFAFNPDLVKYDKYPIDGKLHILTGNAYDFYINFNINVINRNNNYSELQNATCTLTTTYKGKTGILVYISKNQSYYSKYGTGSAEIFIKNNKVYTYHIDGWTNQYFPYYAPTLQVFNKGCSIYGDGNICTMAKQALSDTLYIQCSYDQ